MNRGSIVSGLVLATILLPQVALAAWWNPFTWKIFTIFFNHPPPVTVQAPLDLQPFLIATTSTASSTSESATTTADMTLCNGQYWNQCPDGQILVCPTDGTDAYCSIPKTPKLKSASPSPAPKPAASPPPPSKTIDTSTAAATSAAKPQTNPEDNFRETTILLYAKAAEGIKRFISENKSYVSEMQTRRNELSRRVGIIRSISFPNSGDGAILNNMFEIFAEGHEDEAKFIDSNIEFVNKLLDYLSTYESAYNSSVAILLADPKKVVTREEFIKNLEKEKDVDSENVYKAESGLLQALSKYFQSVSYNEDQYQKSFATLQSALAKVSSSAPTPSSYYQALPATNFNLSARQQLILNPIQCTISGDGVGLRAYVSCY